MGTGKKEGLIMERNKPHACAVFGIDIGKNLFHVVGLDNSGAPVQRAKFRRDTLLQFFERAEPNAGWHGSMSRVAMACSQTTEPWGIRCVSSRPSL
jgi:hypothetical protein